MRQVNFRMIPISPKPIARRRIGKRVGEAEDAESATDDGSDDEVKADEPWDDAEPDDKIEVGELWNDADGILTRPMKQEVHRRLTQQPFLSHQHRNRKREGLVSPNPTLQE